MIGAGWSFWASKKMRASHWSRASCLALATGCSVFDVMVFPFSDAPVHPNAATVAAALKFDWSLMAVMGCANVAHVARQQHYARNPLARALTTLLSAVARHLIRFNWHHSFLRCLLCGSA